MNIVKCSNGHFYDADSYRSCPHCENNLFSEDMATVNVPADKLYDDKTFSLYGESEGEKTMPADLSGDIGGYSSYPGSSDGYPGSGGPYSPAPGSYARKDSAYYPDDEEGTVPADLDGDMTIPADISPSSLSDQVLSAMNPDILSGPTRDYTPHKAAPGTPDSPVYSNPPAHTESPVYPEARPYTDNPPYSNDSLWPGEIGKGRETAPAERYGGESRASEYSDGTAGGRTKLTISPSLNRPKPSSWPADNGENSIDFEAEREAEEYAASQEFNPMSDAFHAAKLDQSMESVDEDKDEVGEAAAEDAVEKEAAISEEIRPEADEIFLPEADEYIPEFDDEVIPIEDDSYEMESIGLEADGFGDLPDIQAGEILNPAEEAAVFGEESASFEEEAEALKEEPVSYEEEAMNPAEEAAVFEKDTPIPFEEEVVCEDEASEEHPASFEEEEGASEEESVSFKESEEVSEEESASPEKEAGNPFFIPEISFEENMDSQASEDLADDSRITDLPVGENAFEEEAGMDSEENIDFGEGAESESSHDPEDTIDPDRTYLRDEDDHTVCLKTTGWLVCIDGEAAGCSMEIYDGINAIHPLAEGICIRQAWDNSDGKEAVIIYDKESGQFRIQAGFSGMMIYVNDSLVLQPVRLRDRDRISVGSSEYIFVPFCDDNFRW